MNSDPYHLEVDKKELTDALRQITKFKKRGGKRELMMLSFADGVLRLTMWGRDRLCRKLSTTNF